MLSDDGDRELLKIEAIADLISIIDPIDLDKRTLNTFGVIQLEACEKIREIQKGETK